MKIAKIKTKGRTIRRIRSTLLSPQSRRGLQVRRTRRGLQVIDRLGEMSYWWERWPGRLEYEKERLAEAGIKYREDASLRERGVIALDLEMELNGNRVALRAVFPDLYPDFRFEVFANQWSLPRHQHPFFKNLCLIGRSLEQWRPSDTLAEFLTQRLPLALKAATDRAAAERTEERYGEPFSNYYTYLPRAVMLVDKPFWRLDVAIEQGQLRLVVDEAVSTIGSKRIPVLRAGITDVRHPTGEVIARTALDYSPILTSPKKARGRWVRMDAPIAQSSSEAILKALAKKHPELGEPKYFVAGRWRFDVIGAVFPEEVQWRRENDGWLFLVRFLSPSEKREGAFLVRPARTALEQRMTRTPELQGLESKVVTVIGLGCIGGPSVLELARAGVGEIRLIDFDYVDAETISRWPLGLGAAGEYKTEALGNFLNAHYPHTKVRTRNHRLGVVRESAEIPSDSAVLEEMLSGSDLLFDATAELPLQKVLSAAAGSLDIPYIGIWATSGGWGGAVVRLRGSGEGPCWMCLQHHLNDGSIAVPPHDGKGMVQPEGCADPTFTASAFDTSNTALAGVRLAVSTLSESLPGGYPALTADVQVLALREADGTALLPRWRGYDLGKHPECQCHDP